jgi:hypothetical protein
MLAGCGGGGKAASAPTSSPEPTTTAPATHPVTFRIIVVEAGLGCGSTTPIDGAGSPLIVKDEHGTIVAKGTWARTTSGKTCDWSAKTEVMGTPNFVTLVGSRGDLITLARADVHPYMTLVATAPNDVQVLPMGDQDPAF